MGYEWKRRARRSHFSFFPSSMVHTWYVGTSMLPILRRVGKCSVLVVALDERSASKEDSPPVWRDTSLRLIEVDVMDLYGFETMCNMTWLEPRSYEGTRIHQSLTASSCSSS